MWCELLSEALAALWSSSVTSDPDRWLKWDPLRPACPEIPKMLSRAEHMVLTSNQPSPWTRQSFPFYHSNPPVRPCRPSQGPALLSRAVWSRCMLGVLSSSEAAGRWEPSGEALLSMSRVSLGEWKERVQQLQDVSAVLWDNMALPSLAEFR